MFVNPQKRAETLEKIIAARRELRNEETEKVLDRAGFQESAAKLFKPIIEREQASKKEVLKAITDGSESNMRDTAGVVQAIRELESPLVSLFEGVYTGPQAIEGAKEPKTVGIDPTLLAILESAEEHSGDYDRDYAKGIQFRDRITTLGQLPIRISEAGIKFEGKTYPNSQELFELLTIKNPIGRFSDEAKQHYVHLLSDSGLLYKRDGTRQGWKGRKYELIKDTIDKMISDGSIPKRREKKGGALKQGR